MANSGWSVAKVRSTFIQFFANKEHIIVKSAPVIPYNDPTLLFINARMNQFKPIFLGNVDPSSEFGRLSRAVDSQLCIRAGGKHNDLDDVGRDTYHHTFFEMLGSWSFGDYFKKDAISWAWELLTKVYGLQEDRLYVTYFEGDSKAGLEPDNDARNIWRTFVPEERIIKGNAKDNFWEMGETGPCGPCTEIHYDRIGSRNAADLVNKDDPMVIEVWNIVFIQYDRQADKSLKLLPKPCVDTGMGLERITSILQGVTSNYDTDAWTPIFAAIQTTTKFPHSYASVSCNTNDDVTVAYRVIADHARCITVALADGAIPDSVGRGFVLRRIIRRAIRYGVQFLGAKTGFFSAIVDSVAASLSEHFLHLSDPKTIQRVKAIVLDEEEAFAKTWKNGLKQFAGAVETVRKSGNSNMIGGKDVFILHDRYGFPVDLTALLAEKEQMTIDLEGFADEMRKQQSGSEKSAASKNFLDTFQIEELNKTGIKSTKDEDKYLWNIEKKSKVLAIFDKENKTFLDVVYSSVHTNTTKQAASPNTAEGTVHGQNTLGIILDATSFYSESGGQVGDTGLITTSDGSKFEVSNVLSFGGFVVHIGEVRAGTFKKYDEVVLQIDYDRRFLIGCNHTATHVLNHKLRQVLEYEKTDSFMPVNQKGSLVNSELLRFDFSYIGKMKNEELQRVEAQVNEAIAADLCIYTKEVPLVAAKQIKGIRMMFGEKYPKNVSVVCIGHPLDTILANPENETWRQYSIELCGGTHLESLGKIKHAVIISEEALMKGVRRIVMYTEKAALKALAAAEEYQKNFDSIVDNKEINCQEKVKLLTALNIEIGESSIPLVRKNELRTAVDTKTRELFVEAKNAAAELRSKAIKEGAAAGKALSDGMKYVIIKSKQFGADNATIQAYVESFSAARSDVAVFFIGVDDEKERALVLATIPKTVASKQLNAADWIKASCGKGGGKPHQAQSGILASESDAVESKAATIAQKLFS